jgi:hypothetical protein
VWGRKGVELAGTGEDEGEIVELIVGTEFHDDSPDLGSQLGRVRVEGWRGRD